MWISFNDRKPPFGSEFLACDKSGNITLAERVDRSDEEKDCVPYQWAIGVGIDKRHYAMFQVRFTHWMPLPDRPEKPGHICRQPSEDHKWTW